MNATLSRGDAAEDAAYRQCPYCSLYATRRRVADSRHVTRGYWHCRDSHDDVTVAAVGGVSAAGVGDSMRLGVDPDSGSMYVKVSGDRAWVSWIARGDIASDVVWSGTWQG